MDAFKVIIVEDVKLELKGTEQLFHSEIPSRLEPTVSSSRQAICLNVTM